MFAEAFVSLSSDAGCSVTGALGKVFKACPVVSGTEIHEGQEWC